jgi:CheY-like chemotaxis protein
MAGWHYERMPRSVLVVDDDAGFRDLATRILTSWGHAVIGEAGSVAEALAQATRLRPDVVLVDIGLPDGDGFSLTEQLVAMPWAVRVVLISSQADRATVAAARRAGADSFLPKDELSSALLRQLIEGW